MDLKEAARAFLDHRRKQGRKANTIENYAQQIRAWFSWRSTNYGWSISDVNLKELQAYVDSLRNRLKPETVRNYVRGIRTLWNWLAREVDEEGKPLLRADQLHLFAPGRLNLPKKPERERPAVSRDQVDRLVEAAGAGDDEKSARNRAILLLLWESGLRIHELANLTTEACDFKNRTAIVIGKGDKQAPVFWGPRTAVALRQYLRLRRGALEGPLFRGCSSRNPGGPITPDLVRQAIKRIAELADVELPHGSPVHSFRHGAAREWRRRGASRAEVGELLRHDDPRVTRIYLGLDVEPRRNVHRRLYGDNNAGDRRRNDSE